MQINELAKELNNIIESRSPEFFSVLSRLGRSLYFPMGILTQTAEAREKASRIDATIGIAREKSDAMSLASVLEQLHGLAPDEAVDYAPATGKLALRRAWLERIKRKNPGLAGKDISLPIVTSGITHGITICADLFADPDDVVLIPDKYWENYGMIFQTKHGAEVERFPFFSAGGGFNTGALVDAIRDVFKRKDKLILLLNFPNNPTGYSLKESEAHALADSLIELARPGKRLIVIVDDAYSGFVYEDGVFRESVFAILCEENRNLFPVKLDGATKELYAWGMRVGFMTFYVHSGGGEAEIYSAVERKVGGNIRGTISNSSMLSQSILLKALENQETASQEEEKLEILKERARTARECAWKEEYLQFWEPYEFNSGYFMCVRMKGISARDFRRRLLENWGVGLIAENDTDLRIAFSAVEAEEIPALFDIMYRCASGIVKEEGGSD